jgi:hypothetical protein
VTDDQFVRAVSGQVVPGTGPSAAGIRDSVGPLAPDDPRPQGTAQAPVGVLAHG